MSKNKNFIAKRAFSLAELMIVMLVLTIILAATMPILSKRAKVKAAAAVAAGRITTTANEGDSCIDGTDRLAVTTDGRILTCMPTEILGDSCDNATEVGHTAVDNTTMSGTDNPYVHLVCIAN